MTAFALEFLRQAGTRLHGTQMLRVEAGAISTGTYFGMSEIDGKASFTMHGRHRTHGCRLKTETPLYEAGGVLRVIDNGTSYYILPLGMHPNELPFDPLWWRNAPYDRNP